MRNHELGLEDASLDRFPPFWLSFSVRAAISNLKIFWKNETVEEISRRAFLQIDAVEYIKSTPPIILLHPAS